MEYENIFDDLKELYKKKIISKKELIIILKKYGKLISVYDLMLTANLIRDGVKYVQEQYKDQFVEPYVKTFIFGITELLNQEENLEGYIDKELFKCCLDNLEYNYYKENDKTKYNFRIIIAISSLFVTFITEQPLHPVGSIFPGNLTVYEENGTFYCPVKDAQKDNPDALCIFCLADQTPNIH